MNTLIDAKKVMKESRVVLSPYIREKLKLNVGDVVNFIEDEEGNIYLKKATA
jgi:hypothetical protein